MNYLEELDKIYKKIKEERKDLILNLQKKDLKEQDILHYIENESYDAIKGTKLLKALKIVRKERREIKEQLAELQSIEARLKNSKFNNSYCFKEIKKSYTPKIITFENLLKET